MEEARPASGFSGYPLSSLNLQPQFSTPATDSEIPSQLPVTSSLRTSSFGFTATIFSEKSSRDASRQPWAGFGFLGFALCLLASLVPLLLGGILGRKGLSLAPEHCARTVTELERLQALPVFFLSLHILATLALQG